MVYSTEVVIPIEIGLPILCSDIVDRPKINQNLLLLDLDLAKETRQIAQIRLASYQQQAHNFYAQGSNRFRLLWVIGLFAKIPTHK